jgi:glycylpeptide N-tetradecanoyltransferase
MSRYPTTYTEAQNHTYEYWTKKPVKSLDCKSSKIGYVDKNIGNRKPYTNDTPIKLDMLEWRNVDINNTDELNNVTEFINQYYAVDPTVSFRLRYETEFIKWVLQPFEHELLTLMFKNHIVGTASYSLKNMVVENTVTKVGEVNFLCVHPKFRKDNKHTPNKQYMVHSIIDEISRRIANKGFNVGVFTTSKYVPTPTSVIRTFHRPLNYRKLFENKFTLIPGDTESIHKRFMDTLKPLDAYQPAQREHIPRILELYNEFTDFCNVSVLYTEQELEKLLFGPYVRTYVIMGRTGVVDFVSYFIKEQTAIKTNQIIKSVQLFLYSCNKEDINVMVANTIRLAVRDVNPDLFNATDICRNSEFLLSNRFMPDEESDQEDYDKTYDHKFMKGTGKMYINFFNFATSQMYPSQIFWVSL